MTNEAYRERKARRFPDNSSRTGEHETEARLHPCGGSRLSSRWVLLCQPRFSPSMPFSALSNTIRKYAEPQQKAKWLLHSLNRTFWLAGLGMPNSDDPGRKPFFHVWPSRSGSSASLPPWRRSPYFWTSAVSCVGEGNSELRLVSAVPRKMRRTGRTHSGRGRR